MPDIRRSSLLGPVKIGYRRCRPNSINRPYRLAQIFHEKGPCNQGGDV
jgi:hypothetical protein